LWLLYDAATSPQFQAARLLIAGHQLTEPSDIQAAAAVGGQNLFWLRPREVAQRIGALPAVAEASVDVLLPNTVQVHIRERTPIAVWQSGDMRLVVDGTGKLLAPAAVPLPLPTVRDLSQEPVGPGAQVDADAIKAATELTRLLFPRDAGLAAFEYASQTGMEVPDLNGLRVRFGSSDDLSRKLLALGAIREQLTRNGTPATFVDVRFVERPYYR
jgi:cell division septal protein FtsQ